MNKQLEQIEEGTFYAPSAFILSTCKDRYGDQIEKAYGKKVQQWKVKE